MYLWFGECVPYNRNNSQDIKGNKYSKSCPMLKWAYFLNKVAKDSQDGSGHLGCFFHHNALTKILTLILIELNFWFWCLKIYRFCKSLKPIQDVKFRIFQSCLHRLMFWLIFTNTYSIYNFWKMSREKHRHS